MAKRARHEDALQVRVVQEFLVIKQMHPDFTFFAVPNEGARSPAIANWMKTMGFRPGAPDLCIFFRGKAACIELKAPGKVTGVYKTLDPRTDTQKAIHSELEQSGIPTVTLDSLDSVLAFLDRLGVPRVTGRVEA